MMDKLKLEAQAMLGLRINARQMDALKKYEQELLDWNARFNLTAIRDAEAIRVKHFLDSLTCLLAMREAIPTRMIDIGTGAGFPGIPLKIILPNMQLTLVESVKKKADFCQHVVRTLCLEGVEVISTRAEEVGRMAVHRQQYDWAVARAVAVMPVLVEYLLPLVKVGGHVLAQKGESAHVEAQSAGRAMQLLGGQLRQLIPVTLPGVVEERFLVVIDKVAATPPAYPRRTGIPQKNPL